MNSCSFTLFIFVAVIYFRCLSSTRAATCHPDDEAGLLGFKSGITKDPVGILSSWKKGTPCCSWNGITCDGDGRVTMLDITGKSGYSLNYLSGTISPSLAKVQHLVGLYLINQRNLTGSFPQFLFKLPNLYSVFLVRTSLFGPLPANIGSLNTLVHLNLQGNQFTGPIPGSISNLTRMVRLNLGGNRLSGTIPNIFKSMTSLKTLNLSRNGFSEELPPSIASLAPTLQELILNQNNLSGTIPDYLSRFKALSTLQLSKNRFSGVVPMSFANLKSISFLELSHNLLSGPFPALHNQAFIRSLDLSYNQFQLKTIPEWVSLDRVIPSLKLAKCGIKMSLDDWKPAHNFFDYIDLSENEISGSPVSFMNNNKDSLLEFLASGNKLRFDMGKLNFGNILKVLDLSRNLVFGEVPKTVAGLKKLNLSQNHLCEKLPTTKFLSSAFARNDCLCGSPLAPCKP